MDDSEQLQLVFDRLEQMQANLDRLDGEIFAIEHKLGLTDGQLAQTAGKIGAGGFEPKESGGGEKVGEWTNVELHKGENFGGEYPTVQVRLINGGANVQFKGLFKAAGVIKANEAIITVPAAFRPPAGKKAQFEGFGETSASAMLVLAINHAGEVSIAASVGGSAEMKANQVLNLDSIVPIT